jgi:CheY-like chemotaxis protein
MNRSITAALRILTVDSCTDGRETTTQLLRMWGFETQSAGDGASALALARLWRPDVVLLELRLPKMSGFELARQLRAAPETGGALVVALTGQAREQDRRDALEAGCDLHLAKPADLDELRRLFDNHQFHRAFAACLAQTQSEPTSIPAPHFPTIRTTQPSSRTAPWPVDRPCAMALPAR